MVKFIYGTAWKEKLTEECVFNALKLGFRAVDTANQPKHYYEEGVGIALSRAYSKLKLKREDIFLQTKYTYAQSQGDEMPYDERAPHQEQLLQSFESSLEHLKTDYLDSFLLHSPLEFDAGLTETDWAVWKNMEKLHRQGKVKNIGISNVNLEQLKALYKSAKIKPKFVQNRCFADTKWDQDIRKFCSQRGILYQGFSLLTANRDFFGGEMTKTKGGKVTRLELGHAELHPDIQAIIERTGMEIQQIVFRFAQQIGMVPLTGTQTASHMRADIEAQSFKLKPAEIKLIENIAFLA